MLATWAQEEMASAKLGDRRLNQRLARIVSALGGMPRASISAACGGRSEMAAAYRFFENEKVSLEQILQPHMTQTRRRIEAQQVALLVQDTTEIDVTRPEQQVTGAGPMDGSARRGFFAHVLHAFAPDGTPLGTINAKFWARPEESLTLTPQVKRDAREIAAIEDKESFRWLEGLRQARELAQSCPTVQCICVADSESDIFEVFAEPRGAQVPVDWLIRACQNRRARPGVESETSPQCQLLRSLVATSPVRFTNQITVRGRKAKTSCETRARRQPRKTREATVEVRCAPAILSPPPRPDRQLPPVKVNIVQVLESAPPQGELAVEWLLVTTLPIDTTEQVRLVIQYYTVRWMIELLFRTLKSGCRIEARRFEYGDHFLRCLAVYLIAAWRTLFVCRMGRSCPDLDCDALFEPAEWKSVWMVVKKRKPPRKVPCLQEMVNLIAQLGGYLPDPKDVPGPQTIWLGLQRMHDLALAWETFGPGSTPRQDVRYV